MYGGSLICVICQRHVRSGERVCPHCSADLAAPGATRRPVRRALELRRILFVTVTGIGAVSCGGRIYGDGSATEQASPSTSGLSPTSPDERLIAGACLSDNGTLGHCGPPYPAPPECACGPAGQCMNDLCVPQSCESGSYLTDAGYCSSIAWFAGAANDPSSHSCYGSPPFLG